MMIEGYINNPFPFEIGDHLLDEDGDECILEDANYFHCRLHWLSGELASQGDGRFTARTETVHHDFKRKSDTMNTWTDEQLKAHLDEWHIAYQNGERLDIGLNQYPVMFDGDGTQTQTILRCGSEQIVLAATQLYEVDTWFRHHPMKPG